MASYIDFANRIVWGAPALILILGVGLFLSIRTGFAQLTLLPKALRLFVARLRQEEQNDGISPFQALCTALAATAGTGNLVGVAGAISLGGPGAVFWMWICAGLGMITKFAEASLAVHFRVKEKEEYIGGPMYMISRGLGNRWNWLGKLYCLFGVIAAFGVGNATQINAVVTSVNQVIGVAAFRRNLGMGLLLALAVGAMLLGGTKRIGQTAEFLVPFASAAYMLLCMAVLLLRVQEIPNALLSVFRGAFSPRAVTGGMVGSGCQALRIGVSRGVFTNEAGMGTASIAHASARVGHPAEQGLMGIMEVFLDTVVMCTLTALVILCSGVAIPYGTDAGALLTGAAFGAVLGDWTSVFLAAALCCFAFATVLGWGLYGARCAQYLFGRKSWGYFAAAQTAVVILGAVMENGVIWSFAETVNGLMAVPNLIALVGLSGVFRKLTMEYKMKCGGEIAAGGTYENLNQRKPLSALSHAEIPSLRTGSKEAGQKDLSPEHRSARSAYPSGLLRGHPEL